jgi:effector-binding domain-containing protein
MTIHYLPFAFMLLLLATPFMANADAPSAAPSPSATISDVRLQDLKSYTYAFVSTQTTLNKLQDSIAQLMPRVEAAMDSGALRIMGPCVFTYHGASEDRNKPFTLDIGMIIKDGTTAPDGFQLIKVPSPHCATVIFTGPASQLPQAYGKLYGELGRRGLQPTDVSREVYLYWESLDSTNNVIQLQAELSPSPLSPSPGM